MTTFTPRAERYSPRFSPRSRRLALRVPGTRAGFTLAEVLVASTLSSLILAAALSTFLLVGRMGHSSTAYAVLNNAQRIALERFKNDVRLATDLRWSDNQRLVLLFPPGKGAEVVYAFEPNPSPTATATELKRFVRRVGASPPEILVAHVAPDSNFARYGLPAPGEDQPAPAANDRETKLLEIHLHAVRPAHAGPAARLALSTRCVMRNKTVGQ